MGADIGRRRGKEEVDDYTVDETLGRIDCSIKGGYIDMVMVKVPLDTNVVIFVKGRPDIIIRGRIMCYDRKYGNVLVIDDEETPVIIKYRDIKFIKFNTKNYMIV